MKKRILKTAFRMSRNALFGLLVCCLFAHLGMAEDSSAQSIEDVFVEISAENNSVENIFGDIENATSFSFLYSKHRIEVMPHRISFTAKKRSVADILRIVSRETGLHFRQVNSTITVKTADIQPIQMVEQVQETIEGAVSDAQSGETLPGVNILVKGTSIGTSTDQDGNFELTVPSLEDTLVVSFVGYQTGEVPINGRTKLDIKLSQETVAGEELVVVGYGTQKRSDLTGSISSIDRREIVELPVYAMDNVLQGKSAGVEVIVGGYRPGQTSSIRIRGVQSFSASNAPLVVMDGVPMEGGLMELNPKDVESVEVLKDVSATAIYGSRAANGVILITTRRGQEGRIEVEYNGYTGMQYTFDRIDMMDTQQYAEFVRDAHRMEGTYTGNDEDIFSPWQLEAIAENRTTDWQDLVFDRGYQQNHTLSIRGGNENTRYAISGTIDDHKATVVNNDYRRYSTRINLDQNISSRIRAGITAYLSNSLRHTSVSIGRVIKNSPMSNPYDEEDNIRMEDELGDRNPLFDMQQENNLDERTRTRVIGTLYAEADLIPEHLSLRTTFSPDFRFRTNADYRRGINSTASKWEQNRVSTLYEAILDYQTTFFEAHRLDVTTMYSVQNYKAETINISVEGLPYEHQLYHNLGSADIIDNWDTALSEWTLESYMLRANYVYDDRYLLTLTGRIDGSSRLAEGNKYGLFPSMALAWQIGNETFMQDVDFLSELKLRFSIGETGNTAIDPYETQGTLSTNDHDFSDQEIRYFEHGNLPNQDLRWERTRSMDLGLDFAFMEDRFRGSIDLYQSDTFDLLMSRQLPYTSGYTGTLENVGETRNRGFEFELSSVNVQTQNFTWSTDLNFATNRNEIVSLYGGTEDDVGSGWFIDEPINVHYYWDWDGIWQSDEAEEAAQYGAEPGDVRVLDVNEDGIIDDDDRVILGNPYPKWTGGITNRLQYKNWDFSLFLQAVQGTIHRSRYGSSIFDDILALQAHASQENQRNVDYWMPDNPSNEFERPRIGSQERNWIQGYFDTSFIRVRNISLGYSISQELLSKIGARNARIYASVQNPVTFTSFDGYDPEGARNYDMPNYTTFLLGVDLRF